jgi:hypothetical protein
MNQVRVLIENLLEKGPNEANRGIKCLLKEKLMNQPRVS